jgi:pimeloyl-ACP methyl ester carboxylesterase
MIRGESGGGSGGSAANDLMGLVIGIVGALCVYLATLSADPVGVGAHEDGWLRWFDGGAWSSERVVDGERVDRGVVVLVHGLDEPGGIWDDLAPALEGAGFEVARFDYPNDQAIGRSAIGMSRSFEELSGLGVETVDVVAHSMGGLVSREALTNETFGGVGTSSGEISGVRVDRLILCGTPNYGSGWARLRGVAEVRERLQRWMGSDDLDWTILSDLGDDGDGQAGVDLLPGSDFLTALNAREMPEAVRVTCLVARMVEPTMTAGREGFEDAARSLGDGVVTMDSAALEGCDDVVVVVANHRSMLRTVELEEGWRAMVGGESAPEPVGIGIVLDRLLADRE